MSIDRCQIRSICRITDGEATVGTGTCIDVEDGTGRGATRGGTTGGGGVTDGGATGGATGGGDAARGGGASNLVPGEGELPLRGGASDVELRKDQKRNRLGRS